MFSDSGQVFSLEASVFSSLLYCCQYVFWCSWNWKLQLTNFFVKTSWYESFLRAMHAPSHFSCLEPQLHKMQLFPHIACPPLMWGPSGKPDIANRKNFQILRGSSRNCNTNWLSNLHQNWTDRAEMAVTLNRMVLECRRAETRIFQFIHPFTFDIAIKFSLGTKLANWDYSHHQNNFTMKLQYIMWS